MADEIKLETHMCWDPQTNMIVGVCQEHGKTNGLKVCSMAQAFALYDGLHDQKVHLAIEVCVFCDCSMVYKG